jgi:hypothetical protein
LGDTGEGYWDGFNGSIRVSVVPGIGGFSRIIHDAVGVLVFGKEALEMRSVTCGVGGLGEHGERIIVVGGGGSGGSGSIRISGFGSGLLIFNIRVLIF